MYELIKSVRNRYRPEACMATNYIADDALDFVHDYTTLSLHIRRRMWDMEEDEKIYGGVLEGGQKKIKLNNRELFDIHKYVVWNFVPTQDLLR